MFWAEILMKCVIEYCPVQQIWGSRRLLVHRYCMASSNGCDDINRPVAASHNSSNRWLRPSHLSLLYGLIATYN
jgi:hypothetical protein